MKQIIDMRFIRYLNLFSKITGVESKNCFFYNNFLIFGVPSSLISKSIGKEGKNVKKLSNMVNRKIKIVALPENVEQTEKFVSEIIAPVQFKNLEITQDEIIITATRQSKAAIIGRNKVRLIELKKIIESYFDKRLRIV
tara:strand:+ start:929 stop:1345 length:417 start_codon:yes stop_codon:yes gene_type:complete